MRISVYKNAKDHTPIGEMAFDEYIKAIRDGKWISNVIDWRAFLQSAQASDKQIYQATKAKLPTVSISGTFSYCDSTHLVSHSGIIAIDFDIKDNPQFEESGIPKDQLAADPYTLGFNTSASDNGGVAVYVKIDGDRHLDAYLALERYYLNTYELVADKSCKDVTRLRYVSYDADAYYNPKSAKFTKYLPKAEQEKRKKPANYYLQNDSDFDFVVSEIQKSGICLNPTHEETYRIGFAIARKYGEGGRVAFHTIMANKPSYQHSKYDKYYNAYLKTRNLGIGMGTFYQIVKDAGLPTKTPRTSTIEQVAKVHRAKMGKNGGAPNPTAAKQNILNHLKQMEEIEGADVEEMVDKVLTAKEVDIEASDEKGDVFQKLITYIKSLNLRFNEVTRCVEMDVDGITREINDSMENTIYINAKLALGTGVKQGDVESMINSDIPKPFHPFKDFFNKYSNYKPMGLVERFLDCFSYESSEHPDYKEKIENFIFKWLLSIIAQMHGIYSSMCLILVSPEMGINKTKFFRELLPVELKKYFGEDSWNKGKDSEVMMCRNLLLLNDELKFDPKELDTVKKLLSTDVFDIRRHYGKYYEKVPRYAVLCATSNRIEVMPDVKNRRFIPVNITKIDYEKMKDIDRTLLFMELYSYYLVAGDKWQLSREDIIDLARIAECNREISAEEETVLKFFRPATDQERREDIIVSWMTNTEILTVCANQTGLKYLSGKKMGIVLNNLGFIKINKKRSGNSMQCYATVKIGDF